MADIGDVAPESAYRQDPTPRSQFRISMRPRRPMAGALTETPRSVQGAKLENSVLIAPATSRPNKSG